MSKDNTAVSKRIGIAAILGASIMWAIEPTVAKLAYTSSGVLQTATTRGIVTALVAMVYALATNRGSLRITKKQFPKLLAIALAGTVFADLLYFYSLTKIPVINAVLIGHMQPVFIVLIGFLVLREDRLNLHDYIGIAILIVAGLLVSTRTLSNLAALRLGTYGDLVVLLATLGWATAGIIMRKYLTAMNAGVVTFYRFTIASAFLVVILLVSSDVNVPGIYEILVGVVVGVGYILYYESVKRIKAAQAAALELSTPFFAALLGFLILAETVTVMQILGIGALFLGIYFLSKKEEVPF